MKTLVMKFGGAAFANIGQFSQIADLIIARRQEFSQIIVVVSAMGGMTDQLIQLAKKVHPQPPKREYDMLISVGERISMSLLAMSLCQKNQEAVSFTGSQSGIVTTSCHADAAIIDVRPYRIKAGLEEGKIVIVAGFQGVSCDKEITTLGRGGSDTTAVALGLALKGNVIFYKDVPGIFDCDPKCYSQAQSLSHLTYREALDIVKRGEVGDSSPEIARSVLHPRAIHLAAKNGLPLQVRSFNLSHAEHSGTLIFDPSKVRNEVPLYENG